MATGGGTDVACEVVDNCETFCWVPGGESGDCCTGYAYRAGRLPLLLDKLFVTSL